MIEVRRRTEDKGESGEYLRVAFGEHAQGEGRAHGFGARGGFSGVRLPPDGRFTPPPGDGGECITYVHRGALAIEGLDGKPSVALAGELLCSANGPVANATLKASAKVGVHAFRIAFGEGGAGSGHSNERTRFTRAQRRNTLCRVVSPDARDGSLRAQHDVVVWSSVLDPGHHIAFELEPERTALVHLISGRATIENLELGEGDSARIASELWVSLIARQSTELLIIDLGPAVSNARDQNDADPPS